MEDINGTLLEEFLLKGFPGHSVLHTIMPIALLLVYLVTLAGNILIIFVICRDPRLHSPMYFFLVSLSFMELVWISTVLPKLLVILITGRTGISRAGCFIQSFLYYFASTSDILILTVMSIDRCVAIYYPLRYSSIMVNSFCIKLFIGCIITPFLSLIYPTVIISRLPFCAHVLDHFFCESAGMLKLVCVDTSSVKLNTIITSVFMLIGCLLIITIAYIIIVVTVIRMPSDIGRQKTFSTCLSHLTMLSIFFGSCIFILIRPPGDYSVETDKIVNLVGTILPPLLNPFIYTLRNKKVKACIRHAVKRTMGVIQS